MTSNHLTEQQRAGNELFLGAGGWGYGMAAPVPLTGEPPVPWGYGWYGGTGTGLAHRSGARADGHPPDPACPDLTRAAAALHGLLDGGHRGYVLTGHR